MSQESEKENEAIKAVVKERSEIVPHSSIMTVRDLAKRPIHSRAILHLHEHGVTQQTELYEALHVTQGTIAWNMQTLTKAGLVKTIRRGEAEGFVLDRRYTYYKVPEHINQPFIKELKKCFEYQCLRTIEKLFSPYEWVDVENLKQNKDFKSLIDWRLGLTFKDALRLITSSGVFYTDADENSDDEVTKFKRAFDNYSRRVPKECTTPPLNPRAPPNTEEVKEEPIVAEVSVAQEAEEFTEG